MAETKDKQSTEKQSTSQDGSSSSESSKEAITSSKAYKELLSESIDRRNTIKALKSERDELKKFREEAEASSMTKEEKTQKQIAELTKKLERAKSEISKRDKLGIIGAALQNEGAVDPDVSKLFFETHSTMDLSDKDAFKESLDAFKMQHPKFFSESGPIKTPDKSTKSVPTSEASLPKDVQAARDALASTKGIARAKLYKSFSDDLRAQLLGKT